MLTMMKNQLMIEQYEELLQASPNDIHLRLKDMQLIISGKDLKVCALTRDEILIEGTMEGFTFNHET